MRGIPRDLTFLDALNQPPTSKIHLTRENETRYIYTYVRRNKKKNIKKKIKEETRERNETNSTKRKQRTVRVRLLES